MYDQYGREQANAILGTVMTKLFLPGLDDVTAEYASKQLGDTTIFSKTFQDYPGKKLDNTRYAEQKRALMHASEIRQIAALSEVLIVSDTAPPTRAAYPPFAMARQLYPAKRKGSPREIHLGQIDPSFLLIEPLNDEENRRKRPKAVLPGLESIVSEEVERTFPDEKVNGLIRRLSEGLTGQTLSQDSSSQSFESYFHEEALADLTVDLSFNINAQYERAHV